MTRPVFSRGDHVELALALLGDLRGDEHAPEPVADEGALHVYDGATGLWVPVPGERLSVIVQSYAGCDSLGDRGETTALKIRSGDVTGAAKFASDRANRPLFFRGAPKGLAFSNGYVRVTADGVTVQPHAPENRARFGYPFAYVTTAPPAFLAFLGSLFSKDPDRAERIQFLQEFFGACLLGIAPTYQKCVASISPGESGRTTLGRIIMAAMPPGSVASIAPQLFSDQYRRAMLAGKLLNFVAELPESEILDSESFKAIVTGDLIDARPIYKDPISFHPVAGHFYAANRLPASADLTHAFFRRFVVLPFTRQFKEGDPERDPLIADRIIATELPAIVGWMIAGAVRLLGAGAYTIPPTSHAALASWRLDTDQVARFIGERLVRSASARPEGRHDWTGAAALYDAYRLWAMFEGQKTPLARNKFGARLEAHGARKATMTAGAFYGLRVCRQGETTTPEADTTTPEADTTTPEVSH